MGQLVDELKPRYDGKINFMAVFVDEEKELPVAEKFNVQFVPMTILFDKNGNAVDSLEGVVDKTVLSKKLEELAK
ncbi:MAG: thioredoxin domain-containing protein [Actinomycetota bacterium]